ncbi:protein translocase subunit SecF [Pantoea sp. SoEX]|uniref:protein translocase subunit SecF n=1 Tax=Pantoea sp. SoEX TaxID=2576763 RepID=UPI001357C51E|nr:protein translocase subunit SecF [Pantoea sp. SoEX]MXP51380.1 protein translocase subunit SecF [Pantoea sp. SoEX]
MLNISNINKFHEGYKPIDFMRWNKLAFSVLAFLILLSTVIIYVFNFNWSIDFTGGTVIEASFDKLINVNLLRSQLIKSGFNSPIIQNIGDNKSVLIKINSSNSDNINDKLIESIKKNMKQKITINRINFVGPSIGPELTMNGIIALFYAILAVFFYIGFRFEWNIAFGIVVALLSDLIITCGLLSLLHIEIDLTIIASLMSIIGYSLNDKIVISDRIRENMKKIQSFSYYDIINISLTQVINRTLMTSLVTLMMVLILLTFGGSLLKGFSLTMVIGIIVGTMSSIYISLSLKLMTNIINNKIFNYK